MIPRHTCRMSLALGHSLPALTACFGAIQVVPKLCSWMLRTSKSLLVAASHQLPAPASGCMDLGGSCRWRSWPIDPLTTGSCWLRSPLLPVCSMLMIMGKGLLQSPILIVGHLRSAPVHDSSGVSMLFCLLACRWSIVLKVPACPAVNLVSLLAK